MSLNKFSGYRKKVGCCSANTKTYFAFIQCSDSFDDILLSNYFQVDLSSGKIDIGHAHFYTISYLEYAMPSLSDQFVFGFNENVIVIRNA